MDGSRNPASARNVQQPPPQYRGSGFSPQPQAAAPRVRMQQRTPRNNGGMGRLCISGKRFFGQILIDHWVIRINGEQKTVPFGRDKMTLELPAGVYLVTAYTPYLGMHCMAVTANVEVRAGHTARILYKTVFDIFKQGILQAL